MRPEPNVQPLWTWPVALVLASLVLGGLYGWSQWTHAKAMNRALNLGRLAAPGAVVVVGDSKVRCDVMFDEDMGAALAARARPVRVVRVGRSAALFSDLAQTFDALERSKPRLVVLQSDFYAVEPRAYRVAGAPVGIDWRDEARSALRSLVKGEAAFVDIRASDNYGPGGAGACNEHFARPRTAAAYARDMAGRRASTPAERRAVLERVRRLQAKGVQVVLLETPRSPTAARAFPARLDHDIRDLLDRQAAADGLAVIGPAPLLAEDQFLDSAHLTASGQRAYSNWLADRIAALLPAPAP